MACEALGARHERHLLSEHASEGHTLTTVVVGRACAVGIDILDIGWLQSAHRQGLCHRQVGSFTIVRRGRLMEGVTGIAIASQTGMNRYAPLQGLLFALEHHVSGSLAQVQASTRLIEGTTGLLVEDHEGTEAVEMEHRESLGATSHDEVCLTSLEHVGP